MAETSNDLRSTEQQQERPSHFPSLITCIAFCAITIVALVITGSWVFFLFEVLIPAMYAGISFAHSMGTRFWEKHKIEGLIEMIMGGLFAVVCFVFSDALPPMAVVSIFGFVIAFNGLWRGFFNKHYSSWENQRKAIRGILWGIVSLAFLIGFPMVLDLLEKIPYLMDYGVTFDWYNDLGDKIWYFVAATWILSMVELVIQLVSNFIQARRAANPAPAAPARKWKARFTARNVLSLSRFLAVVVILTVLFIIWMNILLAVTAGAGRNVVFHDWMSNTDVSAQYSSTVPSLRYIFEPFIGISLVLPFGSNPTERIPFFVTVYVFLRTLLFLINDIVLVNSKKRRVIMAYVEDTCRFAMKYGFLAFLLLIGYALVGYMVNGFIFLAYYFEILLHLGSFIFIFLIIGRGIYNLTAFFHPRIRMAARKADPRPQRIVFRLLHDTSMSFRREVAYFGCAFLLFISVNFTMCSFNLPTQHIQTDLDPDEFLFDFHVHTTVSDGQLTPEQRVQWFMDQGISGAAFADHSTPLGGIRAREYVEKNNLDFTVIVAQEFTDDDHGIHLNIYNIEEPITPVGYSDPEGPNPMSTPDMIAWVKAHGGFVTVNHYWGGGYSRDQLRGFGVDGFEIINGAYYFGDSLREYCKTWGLACVAGSDMHMNYELNTFVRFRLPDPTNRSTTAIFTALKTNTQQCVAVPTFDYTEVAPPWEDHEERDLLTYYFQLLEQGQVDSWIAWSIIIFAGLIAVLFVAWRIPMRCLIEEERPATTRS